MRFDPTMLRIDNQKQLFLDDLLIESAENVCRTWHQPVKQDINPVLKPDRKWEHILEMTVNGFQVLYDERQKLFKCWYMDTITNGAFEGGTAIGDTRFNMLYAESEDGINWRKPLVGKTIDGEKTNVIILDGYGLTSVIDPYEKDENKRYKGLYTSYTNGQDCDSVLAVTSRDGVSWDICPERPSFGKAGAHLDDVMVMSYDPFGRIFLLNTRHYDMYAIHRNLKNPVVGQFTPPYYPLDWRRMNKRRVWQTESADGIHWSEPYPVVPVEDGYEELDETFYGMSRYRTGNVTIGFVTTFHQVPDILGVKLVYSRDGKIWEHLNNRRSFLDRGGNGAWDEFMSTMPAPPIEFKDELYFFYGGAVNHHDWWIMGAREGLDVPEAGDFSKVVYSMGLAKLRMDGFCSLGSGVRPGILITRHFISNGTQLEVNARCSKGGFIKAEVVDAYDEVVPGFSRDECDAFAGDSIRHVFTWNGKRRLPSVPGGRADYPGPETERMRKIRFYMDKAELYSFTMI